MQLVICSVSGEKFLKNFVQLSENNVCSEFVFLVAFSKWTNFGASVFYRHINNGDSHLNTISITFYICERLWLCKYLILRFYSDTTSKLGTVFKCVFVNL
jgi:hypothetical protein